MRFLVIEDNARMSGLICQGFQEQGYSTETATSGYVGEERAAFEPFDAIVLDRMLPDQDGLEVCRNLRRRGVKTPILMLTALATTEERVSGLNAGADDYLGKPFEFDELVARLRALLRRGEAVEASQLKFEDIEMDLIRRTVMRAGKPLKMTAKEFALLEYLMRRPDRVLTRSMIGEQVWDMNFEPGSNVIDVYVSMLRRKIDKGFEKPLLHTIIGAGYMLSAGGPSN